MSIEDWEQMDYEGKLTAFNKVNKAWHRGEISEEKRATLFTRAQEESQALFEDFLFIDELYATDTAFPQRPSNRLLKAYHENRLDDPDLKRYVKLYKDEIGKD